MLKMAPTPEEELKLRLYSGEISKLGPADRFLKALVDIPFAFKRMEALLYMGTLQEELTTTRESFATLEVRTLYFICLLPPHTAILIRSVSQLMIMNLRFLFELMQNKIMK